MTFSQIFTATAAVITFALFHLAVAKMMLTFWQERERGGAAFMFFVLIAADCLIAGAILRAVNL